MPIRGEMGISEEGLGRVREYFSEQPGRPRRRRHQRIVDGEIDYAQQASSGIPGKEEAFGFEVGVVEPEVGVPFVVEQVGIVKGTDQLEDSQDFIDWFGSAEVQAEWSGEFDSMPVNQGAIDQADPSIVEFHEGLARQDIDWEFVTENLGGWVEDRAEYVVIRIRSGHPVVPTAPPTPERKAPMIARRDPRRVATSLRSTTSTCMCARRVLHPPRPSGCGKITALRTSQGFCDALEGRTLPWRIAG